MRFKNEINESAFFYPHCLWITLWISFYQCRLTVGNMPTWAIGFKFGYKITLFYFSIRYKKSNLFFIIFFQNLKFAT